MLASSRALFTRTLRRGVSGEDVRRLQELLRAAGYDPGTVDGNFGARTHAAVVAFQRAQGLDPDGAVGPKTVEALTAGGVSTGGNPAPATPVTPTPSQGTGGSTTGRTGLSLHIGLNYENNHEYGAVTIPPLRGCLNDAEDMKAIADGRGFRSISLRDSEATADQVKSTILRAADRLVSGDIYLITYSGHGSQVIDPREDDQRSETWVLWDRQLIDDELYALWSRFKPGVRVMVISDSCHSGTVTRELRQLTSAISEATTLANAPQTLQFAPGATASKPTATLSPRDAIGVALKLFDDIDRVLVEAGTNAAETTRTFVQDLVTELIATRDLPDLTTEEIPRLLDERDAQTDFQARASEYRDVSAAAAGAVAPECSVLLISGCQDNQTSSDGRPDPSGRQNGAFTKALKAAWESARDYVDLHAKILGQLPPTQSPNLFWATPRDTAFEAQSPFTI